jgi:hypothetical protein
MPRRVIETFVQLPKAVFLASWYSASACHRGSLGRRLHKTVGYTSRGLFPPLSLTTSTQGSPGPTRHWEYNDGLGLHVRMVVWLTRTRAHERRGTVRWRETLAGDFCFGSLDHWKEHPRRDAIFIWPAEFLACSFCVFIRRLDYARHFQFSQFASFLSQSKHPWTKDQIVYGRVW